MGCFEDKVTRAEVRKVIKYGCVMYLIALTGHCLLRYYAKPVLDEHERELIFNNNFKMIRKTLTFF
jgi:hypothetical protein